MTKTKLTWVNHASFMVSDGAISLICDPWIEGAVFNNGWEQLCPSNFDYSDFESLDFIWLSHGHPDHFCPTNIQKINEDSRRSITVLYQKTKDGMVAEFCRKLGFRVVELQSYQWQQLSDGMSIMVGSMSSGDSWSAINVNGTIILNLNDCPIYSERRARFILKMIGRPALVCSQFASAQWLSNPEDQETRRNAGRDRLQQIQMHARIFKPRFIIPFASHVWFCHSENFFMNETQNKIWDVIQFINTECDTQPLVLYPGESWSPGVVHDNMTSIMRYKRQVEKVLGDPQLHQVESCSWKELAGLFPSWRTKILSENRLIAHFLHSITVRCPDINVRFRLDINEQLLQRISDEVCDIVTSSNNMKYWFQYPWGASTLSINARYQLGRVENQRHLDRYFFLSTLNNRGESFLSYKIKKHAKEYIARLIGYDRWIM